MRGKSSSRGTRPRGDRTPRNRRALSSGLLVVAMWSAAAAFPGGPPSLLSRVAAATTLPADSEVAEATAGALGADFGRYESRNYLVFSDGGVAWTQSHVERLERAHHQYLRFCRRMGLSPQPLRHKLVAVVFSQRDRYQAFAREHDGVHDLSLSGYYSPRADRVVFYDVESNPSLAAARESLDDLRGELRTLDQRMYRAESAGLNDQVTALRDARSRYRLHLASQRRRVDEFSHRTGIATTVHEAMHQLLFHTGVQSRSVQYPLWICEGLATSFETDEPGGAFGPDQEYVERRERFDELLEQGPLLPLRRLVTIVELAPHDDGVVDALYNQSYALVTWMSRFRRRELQTYLTTMRDHGSGQPTPSKQLQMFQEAFGDIDRLERAWLAHERSRRSVHR